MSAGVNLVRLAPAAGAAPTAQASDLGDPYDFSAYLRPAGEDRWQLHLIAEGVHCGGCVARIESFFKRQPDIEEARVNLTTRRLVLRWAGPPARANALLAAAAGLGYRFIPYDPEDLAEADAKAERELLRAMAVAGFAAGNIMLLSVSIWAGHASAMGEATRTLLHWFSALIALPAIAYAVRPFARSAWSALRARRTNMDVPITVGVTIATAISLFETFTHGPHAYFDSAVSLLFFLLLGRYLDRRARGKARAAVQRLLALGRQAATVLLADGRTQIMPARQLLAGMTLLVASGERIAADGCVLDGQSELDMSLVTGESLPIRAMPGDKVFAGTVNLGAPIRIAATEVGEGTLLAEIVRLMEAAEQRRARYVALADRIARAYTPVVHLAALMTFLAWVLFGAMDWQPALLIAVSVLIVTCPCALGLAVPAVQVVASGRLMKRGLLLKSATALERLAEIEMVAFDKTGSLTLGRPELLEPTKIPPATLALAAAIAASSRHPLARALLRAAPEAPAKSGVIEQPGAGLAWASPQGEYRLGSRRWCAIAESDAEGPELWLTGPGLGPTRFAFADRLRPDATATIAWLKARGYRLALLSGDRRATVDALAKEIGIADWMAEMTPADKARQLETWRAQGRKVLMVGDGLNDAPALAAAFASLSPASAADLTQVSADAIFQGRSLSAVSELLGTARRAGALVRQNFWLALAYNLLAIPLAMAGYVTPLVAALAMSSSSLIVTGNALRLGLGSRSPSEGDRR